MIVRIGINFDVKGFVSNNTDTNSLSRRFLSWSESDLTKGRQKIYLSVYKFETN